MARIPLLIVLLCSALVSQAQFGDILKKEATRFVKKKATSLLAEELNKTKEKFDSASFSYAVALNDKAAQFESQDKLSDVVTVSNMLINEEKNETSLGAARNYMDIGEMSYAANGFKLAEGSFITANAILYTEGLEANPLYARGMANLGLLYNSMGRYAASLEFTNQALALREKYFGIESKDYAASLNNLAVLNKDLGNYNESEKQITEAIRINKMVAGEEDIAYAISLNNRGVLYQVLGRYEDAETDMLLALEVAEKTLKPSSIQFTRLQSNLAILYQQEGKYPEAEAIYKKAISAIARNPTKSKKSNPDYAHMLENLASLYVQTEQLDEAEELYLEALAVYEKKFGEGYSGSGLAAARLGALYLIKKDLAKATEYLSSAEDVLTETYGPEHPNTVDLLVQLGYLNWMQNQPDKANLYFTKALDKSMAFVGEYFAPMSDTEKALYWKTLRPRFESYYAFTTSVDKASILQKALNYRLATKAMLLSGSTKVKKEILNSGDQALIKDYETWLDQKGTLAHYYAMSKEEIEEQGVNIDSINRAANTLEKSLSERSGLFNEAYQANNPTLVDVQAKLKSNEAAVEMIRVNKSINNDLGYLAVIITPTNLQKVVLSEGEALENNHFKLYRNLIKFKRDDNKSYGNYWQLVDDALGSSAKVYLSLDGVYNQLSLNSLAVDESSYVADTRQYLTIPSLRALGNTSVPQKVKIKQASLVGNPDYQSAKIDPLPGTGEEVVTINKMLKTSGFTTKIKTGPEATEPAFTKSSKAGIIHIATHGFFVADPKDDQTSVFSIPLYNVNENVLLRSGLLFAGAGNNDGLAIGGSSNGVLTSYDVMNLDMSKTDLVVLSACETGLGDIMAGEGVFGLQRAFQIAGAKSVVMSLWKVDDEATKELMVNFYRNWINSGDIDTAFLKAQKAVRSKFSHPYYWGSFVLMRN